MPHRKSSRYEAAHRVLLNRSRSLPPETSPEDLKVRTLKRATAFLHAQIQETQEYTEQLCLRLADRNTQLGEHQYYQREKWRTDRKLATLRLLTESVQPTIPPKAQHETTSPARKWANLSSFFQHGSRKAPLRFNCAVTGRALERRVLKQVSPLVLKPSVPSTRTQSLPAPDNLPPLYVRRRRPEKMIITASSQKRLRSSTSASYSVTEGTPTSSFSPKTPSDDDMGATHDGIALILPPTHACALRSEEEIVAEMGDITLPAYALNLLEDFDYIHDKIPLRPRASHLDRPPSSGTPSSPFIITAPEWESIRQSSSFASPRRTVTVRIPDRGLADALLTSPGGGCAPHRRSHKVSLDPAFFKDDSRSGKLGEVTPMRHSAHVPVEEEGRKPRGLLRKKSSAVFSMISRNSDGRVEAPASTPRRNIASMVKRSMSAINKFR